ncbi:MAG TPA: peptide deformylase [Terrimicrobiaceae bacterium]
MILEIVQYGHPALRAKGRRIEKIDARIRELAQEMLETMYGADGVGLAAQQVGMPIQLCVIDVTEVKDRPSVLRIAGNPVDIEEHMPLVLINPEVETLGEPQTGVEGCLSFPGIRADVTRPGGVRVRAQTLDGSELDFEADGLLARAIQHEFDHLQGILFIDRISVLERRRIEDELRGEPNRASI